MHKLNQACPDSIRCLRTLLQNPDIIKTITPKLPRQFNKQQGFTTLMVILVLLIGLTTVSLTATRSGMLEQSIAGNDIRAKEVQEAAEAALEYSMAWTANHALPWENITDPLIDCPTDANCPVLPGSFTGNDGGAITVALRFERNPASANYIKITTTATQADNNSRATYSSWITQDGTRLPGTWRDF